MKEKILSPVLSLLLTVVALQIAIEENRTFFAHFEW